MRRALKDLCEIASGFSFRGGVSDDEAGTHHVVQLGDVDWETDRVAWSDLPRVGDIEPKPHHHLRAGDVLFAAKGRTNRAIVVPEVGPAVAASTFFVLRPKRDDVLPEYLAWYVNTAPAQAHLLACSRGTNMRSVPKACLSALPVPFPPPDDQHRIATLDRLAREERDLISALADRKARLVEALGLRSALQHSA